MDDAANQRPRALSHRAALIAATAASVALFGAAGAAPAYADDAPSPDAAIADATGTDASTTDASASVAPEPTDPAPSDPPPADPVPSDPPPSTTPPPSDPPPTDPPSTTPPPTETPSTDPPSTNPPSTDPPTTTPPTTPPPTTPPPVTSPPVTPPPTTIPEAPKPAPKPFRLSNELLARVAGQGAGRTAASAQVVQAKQALDAATAALSDAQAELTAARGQREAARSTAQGLDEVAASARADADEAARLYIASGRGGGDALDSLDSVFGAGSDLLAGLGTMQRVSQLTGDPVELRATADRLDAAADAAETRAAEAWAAVDAVPVEAAQQKVEDAEAAVADARSELAAAQSQLAASSITVIDNLPSDSGQLSDQGWSAPVAGRITDGFGPRPDKPVAGVNDFHRGTDLAASCGAPVFAATGGTVVEAGRNGSLGNWILIDHGDGVTTGYGHLVDGGILVTTGDRVEAGGLIGAVGSTGASTGCHVHFEVRLGGIAIDAVPFMAARGIQLG